MLHPTKTLLVLASWCYLLLAFSGCESQSETRFRLVGTAASGIDFSNTITTADTFNILNFHYIYNGGGVGVRDFNQDGLPDLVFSGNQVPSKLYLNLGGLQFKDITAIAGINTQGQWTTGISINDINADGRPDIYFSVGGLTCGNGACNNQLYIHQGLDENGLPIFKEMAADYGLTDDHYTQQALFIDIDRDCDLDVYLLHNVIDNRDKNAPSPQRYINAASEDQLLRNDGEKGFVDVSEAYGIQARGYGLGIAAADFNRDGWPDIYVANDFLSNDLLYLNQEGRTFQELGKTLLKHQSYNSMGVDIADLNGDALAEIMVLDMLPETHERRKRTQGIMNYDKYLYSLRENYAPQFVRNTLQLNNGSLAGQSLPFSEVAYQANLYQTDWSWSPLFADYDNDGDQDLFVTNGYGKDITDLDFINYSQQANAFGTASSVQATLLKALAEMPENRLQNYLLEQNETLVFHDATKDWLPNNTSISNGAAYADLDADGDLDIVVNNIDEAAYVLENTAAVANYLQLELVANCPSTNGAQVSLWIDGKRQYRYYSPVRGYLSTMDDVLHFGMGAATKADSLWIDWPDGTHTRQFNIDANQKMTIRQTDQTVEKATRIVPSSPLLKVDTSVLTYWHQENAYQDYDVQPLLLTQFSRKAPRLAVGEINSKNKINGLFIGTSKGLVSQLYQLNDAGALVAQIELPKTAQIEVVDALFFDADNDADNDLYLVSGSAEAKTTAPQDQLYLNDGKGGFQLANDRLPKGKGHSCVAVCDFDSDGDLDVFLGGQLIAGSYPLHTPSVLLENENGSFQVANSERFADPNLLDVGLVTDATWMDVNHDERPDLVIVGEWMPITVLLNLPTGFEKMNDPVLAKTNGLWQCITPADMDQDGDLDLVIGNYGNNTPLTASTTEPLTIIAEDVDQNGSIDPFVAKFFTSTDGERRAYSYHSRDDLVQQCPKIKQTFVKYQDFAQATFEEIINTITDKEPRTKEVYKMESVWLEIVDGQALQIHDLPAAAQTSPIQNAVCIDMNQDGEKEIFLIGNDYGAEKNGGRHDAFNGLCLTVDEGGTLSVLSTAESGFFVPGDARSIADLPLAATETLLFVTQNEGALLTFRHQQTSN